VTTESATTESATTESATTESATTESATTESATTESTTRVWAADAADWMRPRLARWRDDLAARLSDGAKLSRAALDANQTEAIALARSLGELEACDAALAHARASGNALDSALANRYVAGAVRRCIDRLTFDWSQAGPLDLSPWRESAAAALAREATASLWELLSEHGYASGTLGLHEEHAEVQTMFARFSDDRVAPLAESIHRHDGIIPEPLLAELGALGVFGISIPESYGGAFVDNLTMCIATEELSRGSLGAGGSVITRPEICAKALLKGGTEAQKRAWLPRIASGASIVSVAVTEPNAGSDVAQLRVAAERVDGGYLITGEKTWCTFAGRADVFILLARTGVVGDGARGLTLFLVPKPPTISETEHHHFRHAQEGGGTVEGHAIPTIGYRGMHSFSVVFDQYFVPVENRIGDEGKGFGLQMEGFAGGRIQTAARAVGVMEAAYRAAVSYARERMVFGEPLAAYSATQTKLVDMAATVFASRQLSYRVARMMDAGEGQMEASLVKLISCRDAEHVTREALQIHGGMGYSEEYAVSRYWQDARVLSIFEGAEEVLALYVVARQVLREVIANSQVTGS